MEITIRHIAERDYLDITEIYSQPKAIAGTLQLPFPAEQLWKKRLSEHSPSLTMLVAEMDGSVRGSLGLMMMENIRRRHCAHVGMGVHDDWHGKGIGSALLKAAIDQAENWLAITRLELTVFTDNTPAIALYEKFGFETEGTHRRFAFADGVYKDVYAMAKIKE